MLAYRFSIPSPPSPRTVTPLPLTRPNPTCIMRNVRRVSKQARLHHLRLTVCPFRQRSSARSPRNPYPASLPHSSTLRATPPRAAQHTSTRHLPLPKNPSHIPPQISSRIRVETRPPHLWPQPPPSTRCAPTTGNVRTARTCSRAAARPTSSDTSRRIRAARASHCGSAAESP